MTSILVVYSSLNGENSKSTELADYYLQSREGSETSVTKVDVAELAYFFTKAFSCGFR